LGGGRDTKRADVMVHTDSDTENGHDKARWVHHWSVHGYAVNLTLDVSRRLKVDHFGHWNVIFDKIGNYKFAFVKENSHLQTSSSGIFHKYVI
jgi:hypothetical protein